MARKTLLLGVALVMLALTQGVGAAVTFDARFHQAGSAQASPFAYTSGSATGSAGSVGANSNRVLICALQYSSPGSLTAQAVTWNGVSMTAIGTAQSTGGAAGELIMFGLIAPATGSNTISASWTGSAGDVVLGCVSLYNADQSTGWQNTGTDTATGTSASSAVTSANGNMVVVGHANSNASSTTLSAGTSAYIETCCNGNFALAYAASSGASTTITWTLGSSVGWRNNKLDVIAAGGGGGGSNAPRAMHYKKLMSFFPESANDDDFDLPLPMVTGWR